MISLLLVERQTRIVDIMFLLIYAVEILDFFNLDVFLNLILLISLSDDNDLWFLSI